MMGTDDDIFNFTDPAADQFDQAIAAFDPRTLVVNDDPFDLANKRGRWGRPIVTHPQTGEPTEYERPSKIAKTLDDQTGLIRWAQGMAALGVVENPAIAARIARIDLNDPGHPQRLYTAGEDAKTAASPNRGADWGSLIHQTIGAIHRGEAPDIPAQIWPAIDKYLSTIDDLDLVPVPGMIEVPVVSDHHRLAGTFDIAYRRGDGRTVVADWKTNKTPSWLAWGLQLAIYTGANAIYNPGTGVRTPAVWDRSTALIIHINYRGDEPSCVVHEYDMNAYTGALLLALEVQEWRRTARKHISTVDHPYTPPTLTLDQRIRRLRGHDPTALVNAWTHAGLGPVHLLDDQTTATAVNVIDRLEIVAQIGPSAADWRARLRQLPDDLRNQAAAELRLYTLNDNWETQQPEAVGVLARAETDHRLRVNTVTDAVTRLTPDDQAICCAGTPIAAMTRQQATLTAALALSRHDGTLDPAWTVTTPVAAVEKRHGGKRPLLDHGRRLAKTFGIPAPTTSAAVATHPHLVALLTNAPDLSPVAR